MISALAGSVVLVAPLLFFLAYCRSLLASSTSVELSEDTRRVTEFIRLRALTQLCPPEERTRLPWQLYEPTTTCSTFCRPFLHRYSTPWRQLLGTEPEKVLELLANTPDWTIFLEDEDK